MNLKSIFTFLLLSFCTSQAFSNLSTDDMTKIAGEYSNKRGDALSVSFTLEEANKEQPSLFGPQVVNFNLDLSLDNSLADGIDTFELDEENFIEQENGTYVFNDYEDDCDNPGCANYDLTLKFINKKKGGYWISAKIEVSADVSEIMFENFNEDEYENLTDETLGEFCAEYFGAKEANGSTDYAHCEYEVEIFLSADKK